MTHPEDLLSDYVDGTLGDPERAAVVAHLETCATCREEVELARAAVTALATLQEVPVPFGVTGPVLAEAGRRFERRRAVLWTRLQWAAGLAAAAALVVVVAVNVDLGGNQDNRGAAAGGGASAPEQAGAPPSATSAPPPRLERQADVSYDDASLRSLAEEATKLQATAAAPVTGATGGVAGATGTAGATGATGATAPARDQLTLAAPGPAIACLRTSGAPVRDPADTLVRLIEARFDGTPAYFAVFLEGPGAGQPPDHAVVWVVAKGACTQILDTASLSI